LPAVAAGLPPLAPPPPALTPSATATLPNGLAQPVSPPQPKLKMPAITQTASPDASPE
jgi:hypothetical protein